MVIHRTAERHEVRRRDERTPAEFRAQRIAGSHDLPVDEVQDHAADLRDAAAKTLRASGR